MFLDRTVRSRPSLLTETATNLSHKLSLTAASRVVCAIYFTRVLSRTNKGNEYDDSSEERNNTKT